MSDIGTIAQKVGDLLKARGETIAVAESSSGGLISAALLAVPGASAYFKGGGTVYTGDAKRILMDVPTDAMEANRPATQAHALDLARAAKARLDADWGIGETGAAGPTGNRYGDPPGHSALGVSGPKELAVIINTGAEDRYGNMVAFAVSALELLERCLED
jgi:nicotinamide-nucleotide amidase